MVIDVRRSGPSDSPAENCRVWSSARACSTSPRTARLPVLERCKFIAIFADMIDEFFQVRVVSLEDKVAAGVQTPSVDGVRPRQQLAAIRERVTRARRAPGPTGARRDLLPELAADAHRHRAVADTEDAERQEP